MPQGGLVSMLSLGRSLGAADLASGVPGSPDPALSLVEAAAEAVRVSDHQYEVPDGNLQLRAQIASRAPVPTDPETEVTITVGATEGLCLALAAVVDPGDEVVVIEPFYENFLSVLAMLGGRPRFVSRRFPDWRWDEEELKAAFGPRTRAIVLNSPCNPTGRVLDDAEMAQVAALCERWDVAAVSDETYAPYVYDGRKHLSVAAVPGLEECSVVIGSFSKSHAVSGWRVGYTRATRSLTSVMRQMRMATTCGAPAAFQLALAQAEACAGPCWDPAPEMQKRRDRVTSLLVRNGLQATAPEGGCYVFAGIGEKADCLDFSRRVVTESRVLLAPGRYFFRDDECGSGFVRVAFNKSDQTIQEAENRLTTPLL